MSKKRFGANAVIEWSPTQVSWIDDKHMLRVAGSLHEAAGQLPGRDLVVAVSRRSAFIRAYRVPNANPAEIRRILGIQIGQLFPVPSNELAFDFHLTQDVSSEGRLAVVAAMRSSDLRSLHDQAKSAGLRVVRVVPAALGSPILGQQVGMANCAVVHRTAEGLAVDLVVDGELRYSRVATMPATAIGIDAEVSRTFAAAVIGCSPTVAAGALALPDAEVSTDAWGIETLLGAHLDLDLETPEVLAAKIRKEESRRMRTSLLILAASLVTLTGVYMNYDDEMASAHRDVPYWTNRVDKAKRARDAAKSQAAESDKLLADLERGFHPAQTPSDIVTVASNAAPSGVWLTGFTLERGKAMTIRGTATKGESVVQYQQALVSDPRFRDVTLVSATNSEIDKTPVVQFSMSMFPVGNLPLLDPNAKKRVTSR